MFSGRGNRPPYKIFRVGGVLVYDVNIAYDCYDTGSERKVSACDSASWRRQMFDTYMAPLMNMTETPIFSLRDSLSRQIVRSGKVKISRSERMFMAPYASPALV